MQARVDWVLIIFGTQVIKKKTTGSARVSRLSFRFLWLWFNHSQFLLSKKPFCLQTPSSKYFQVSHLMLLLSEIKQNKIFFPAFFCSSAIAKNSAPLFILFSTINSGTSKLDNRPSFFFLLFCSFCCWLFCSLFAALFFSFWFFYDRRLYIVLLEGCQFPLNLDDLD